MSTFREYCRVAKDATIPRGTRYKSLRYAAERYTWLAHVSFRSVFLDLKRRCGFQVGSVNDDATLAHAATILENARSAFLENLHRFGDTRRSEKRAGRRLPDLSRVSELFSDVPLGVPMPGSPAHANRSARWMEFHDTQLIDTAFTHGVLQMRLSAYVHEWTRRGTGTGWTQPVVLSLASHGVQTALPLPSIIADGSLETLRETFENLVPLPLYRSESLNLRLTLDSGDTFELAGTAMAIVSSGPPAFVEALEQGLRPSAG